VYFTDAQATVLGSARTSSNVAAGQAGSWNVNANSTPLRRSTAYWSASDSQMVTSARGYERRARSPTTRPLIAQPTLGTSRQRTTDPRSNHLGAATRSSWPVRRGAKALPGHASASGRRVAPASDQRLWTLVTTREGSRVRDTHEVCGSKVWRPWGHARGSVDRSGYTRAACACGQMIRASSKLDARLTPLSLRAPKNMTLGRSSSGSARTERAKPAAQRR